MTEELRKYVYKYAYDSVDSWDMDDLVEYAENRVIEKTEQRMKDDPGGMLYEMCNFWNVKSLSEINPDDSKA